MTARQLTASPGDRYRWVALANTTAAMFMATLDGSIVIIALPAIFRAIHLDPLAPGNISYLLWMIMGYRLVQAVLVVSLGRLGDMFGRVKIYNAGFAVLRWAPTSWPAWLASSSAWSPGACWPRSTGARCSGSTCRSACSGRCGSALLAVFGVIETRIADPMFQLSLFRIRAFTAGSIAGFVVSIAPTLPQSLTSGLVRQEVPHGVAAHVGSLPPVSSLFAAVLGVNPIEHLLSTAGALASLPAAAQRVLTGREFFPQLISAPFHHGLTVVFAVAAGLAAVASLLRGGRYVHPELKSERTTTSTTSTRTPVSTTTNIPRKRSTMALTTLDARPALVVIDLQKGITALPGVPPLDNVIGRSASLAAAFRRHGLPVVLVNASGVPSRRTEVSWPAFTPPPDRTDIVPELDQQPGDLLVTKQTWGAFHATPLDTLLRERGVTQIALTGVSTSAGVESTARAAHEHGYHVVLATDAMTDRDPDLHQNSVQRIFPRLGETATTDDLLAMLDQTR